MSDPTQTTKANPSAPAPSPAPDHGTALRRLRKARTASPLFLIQAWYDKSWVVAVAALVGFISAFVIVAAQPLQYRSTAVIPLKAALDAGDSDQSLTELGWIRGSQLVNPEFIDKAYRADSAMMAVLGGEAAARLNPQPIIDAARATAGNMEMSQDASSQTIVVSNVSFDEEAATRELRAIVNGYVSALGAEIRTQRAATLESLKNESGRLRDEAEAAGAAYKEVLAVMLGRKPEDLDVGDPTPLLQRLEADVQKARTEEIRWETDAMRLAPLEGDAEALLGLSEIANHSSILAVRNRIFEQQTVLARLTEEHGAEHPAAVQVAARLVEQQEILRRAALQFPSLLQRRFDQARAVREAAEARLAAHQGVITALESEGKSPETLARDARDKRSRYEAVLQRVMFLEAEQVAAETTGASAIVPSFKAIEVIRPPARNIYAACLGGFGALGLILAAALFAASPRIRTATEANECLGLPVLGKLPHNRTLAAVTQNDLSKRTEDTPALESVRDLRAVLLSTEHTSSPRSVLIASTGAGEGTSTAATNLAWMFSQTGGKTLLVDANLRRPVLGGSIVAHKRLAGLTDFALGIDSLENLVQPVNEKLDLLAAGRAVPNPAELLSYTWLADFLSEASGRYRHIVIDGAPFGEFGDSLLIAPHADAVVLLLQARRSSALPALDALDRLQAVDKRPIGVVLSRP